MIRSCTPWSAEEARWSTWTPWSSPGDADGHRQIVDLGLSLVGVAMGQVVGAYQTGILRHLPDPPVGPFDSDRVDAAEYAYKRASTPDGLIMIVTYG